MDIFGYNEIETILSTPSYSLHSANRVKEGKRYFIKHYKSDSWITSQEIKNELEYFKSIGNKYTLDFNSLQEIKNQYYAIFYPIEGKPLSELLDEKHTLKQKIQIALLLSELCGRISAEKIYLNNFAPFNIVIDLKLESAKLLDFSFVGFNSATIIDRILRHPLHLKYISPELSGRLNKSIDHTSDLYSLGVIMYELFVGENPFFAEDPYQIIHYHLAKQPKSLSSINHDIPETLSDIILKLLKKESAERYQTVQGLIFDLQNVYTDFQNGLKNKFLIGTQDPSLNFEEHIFERQKEIKILEKLFSRTIDGAKEICFLIGPSGTGKSTLINYFKKYCIQNHFFLETKLGKIQESKPFFCFVELFNKFLSIVLKENSKVIEDCKNKIKSKIGTIGKILTDLVPDLELLLGKQAEIGNLPVEENQKRFTYAIRKFLNIITDQFGPVIIFIDDIQWMDKSSLDLLMEIITDKEIKNFFFIAASRDEEDQLIINKIIENLQEKNETFKVVQLSNLSPTYFNNFIAQVLQLSDREVIDLSTVIFKKTSGNPFFSSRFIKDLVKQNLLWFDKKWQWDTRAIQTLQITDNAVKFIASRVRVLPEQTIHFLKLGSCLGIKFTSESLQIISSISVDEINAHLLHGVEESFLLASGNNYQFSHDGIHQACLSLIQDPAMLNLEIGRKFLSKMNEKQVELNLLLIVYHYNFGIPFITDPSERVLLCNLNLQAARKVKVNVAFQSYFLLSATAVNLLPEDAWVRHYTLALDAFTCNVEASYLTKDYQQMDNSMKEVLEKTITIQDKIKIYELMILSFVAQSRLPEAIKIGLLALQLLGIKVPSNPSNFEILYQLVKIDLLLKKRGGVGKIAAIPEIQNQDMYAAIRIICSVGAAAYFSSPNLYPLLSSIAFYLIIKYGHCEFSAFLCASFGTLLIGGLLKMNKGYSIGMQSVSLLKKYDSTFIRCKTNTLFYLFVNHWKNPLRDSTEPLLNAYIEGIESGDTEWASYSIFCHGFISFFCISPLSEVKIALEKGLEKLKEINLEVPLISHSVYLQTVCNLIESHEPTSLKGQFFIEDKIPVVVTEGKMETILFNYNFCKFILLYTFGNYKDAYHYSKAARKRLLNVLGTPQMLVFYYYDSLVIAALIKEHGSVSFSSKRKLKANLNWLKKIAHAGPENGLHRYYIVLGEYYCIQSNYRKAIYFYQKGIRLANSNKYIQDEALGFELLANLYFKDKNNLHYEIFIYKAIEAYKKWGAKTKADILLKNNIIKGYHSQDPIVMDNQLDTRSLINASITISQEINLNKIFEKLISIALQYGGAQKAIFLLKIQNRFNIVAKGNINFCEIDTSGFERNLANELPMTLVNYGIRKKDFVIFNNVAQETQFTRDPYFLKVNPKSVLVGPVIHQGEIIAIMYLENMLAKDVFNSQNVEILKILSAQIAISIINSKYYEHLEEDVRKRTEELSDLNKALIKQKDKIHFQNLQLKNTTEKAEKSAKVKEEFLSLMSHEILTPLNAIIGFTRLLLEERYPAPINQNLNKVKFAADTLLSLIRDILHYLKIESNKIVMLEEDFNFTKLLEGTREMLLPRVLEKGIELNLNLDQNIPKFIFGDKNKLNQTLINIVGNAVKFTHRGSIDINVKIIEKKDEKYNISFSVQDTGIGIEESKLDLIFKEFTQASDTISKNYGGTGLGLAIVQKMVLLLGGEIHVSSKINEGSVFTFNGWFAKSAKDYLPENELSNYPSLKGKSILLIDDETLNLDLVKTILEKREAKVFATESSLIAIEWLTVHSCDIIITDIKMSEMNGETLSKYVREKFAYPKNEIPILALTAHIFKRKFDIIKDSGINDILYKPVNKNDLLSSIHYLIGIKNIDIEDDDEILVKKRNMFPYLSSVFKDEDSFRLILEKHSNKLGIYKQQLEDQFQEMDVSAMGLTLHSLYNVLNALDIKTYNAAIKEMENVIDQAPALIDSLSSEHDKIKNKLSELINNYED